MRSDGIQRNYAREPKTQEGGERQRNNNVRDVASPVYACISLHVYAWLLRRDEQEYVGTGKSVCSPNPTHSLDKRVRPSAPCSSPFLSKSQFCLDFHYVTDAHCEFTETTNELSSAHSFRELLTADVRAFFNHILVVYSTNLYTVKSRQRIYNKDALADALAVDNQDGELHLPDNAGDSTSGLPKAGSPHRRELFEPVYDFQGADAHSCCG